MFDSSKKDNLLFDYPKIFGVLAISHFVGSAVVFFTYKLGKGPSMAAAVLHFSVPQVQITSVILVQATDGGAEKYVNLKLPCFPIFPSPAF